MAISKILNYYNGFIFESQDTMKPMLLYNETGASFLYNKNVSNILSETAFFIANNRTVTYSITITFKEFNFYYNEKIPAKRGVQMAGMKFQTHSNTYKRSHGLWIIIKSQNGAHVLYVNR